MSNIIDEVTAEFKVRYSAHTFRKYKPIVVDFVTWSVQVKKVNSRQALCALGVADVGSYLEKYPVEASASTRNSAVSAIAALYAVVLGCTKDLTSLRARVKASAVPDIILSVEEATAAALRVASDCLIETHVGRTRSHIGTCWARSDNFNDQP